MIDMSLLDVADLDARSRAAWLERILAGAGLAGLIDELTVLGGARFDDRDAVPEAARGWLGHDADPVLQHGLTRLPPERLTELLRRPGLLLGLQELVASEGGPHWTALAGQDRRLEAIATSCRGGLSRRLPVGDAGPVSVLRAFGGGGSDGRPVSTSRLVRRSWFVLLPLAAAAAVAFAPARLGIVDLLGGGRGSGAATAPPGPLKAVLSDGEPDWPAHPWEKEAGGPPAEDAAAALGGLVAGSRDWSRRLVGAETTSAADVSAAATRARDAIVTLGSLAEDGRLPLSKPVAGQVETTCRAAVDRIDRLVDAITREGPDPDRIRAARSDIAAALGSIESLLQPPVAAPDENGTRSTGAPVP